MNYYVTLLLLLSIPSVTRAQYTETDILEMDLQARQLIEQGQYQKGYDLYPDITHAIRIQEGLYSLRQLDYLLELMDFQFSNGEWEGLENVGNQARWLLTKSPDLEGLQKLVIRLVITPDSPGCFEKSGNVYTNWTISCASLRICIANRHISALELSQRVYALTKDRNHRNLVGLIAGKTAWIVRGLEPEYIIELTESGFEQRENFNIKPKYRYQSYLEIQREAEDRL